VEVVLALTCTAVFLSHDYLLMGVVPIPTAGVTLLGTALAFFIGFNNNQSYARWWEARTIWGSIVNDSRSWARNLICYLTPGNLNVETTATIKQKLIHRQLAFVYSLKDTLRKKSERYFERYLCDEDLQRVRNEKNIPNAILTLNASDLQLLSDGKSIDGFRFMQLNRLLTSLTEQMGKSERILNTVFPTSYIHFTRLFIWMLVVFVTLAFAETTGHWTILIGWIIGSVFHITHQNGMGLVNPFDQVPTGIPLDQISRTIEIDLLQMLSEKNIPDPVKPINNDYVL
jgi:putative membrane protein